VTGAVRPALSALPSALPKLAYEPSFDGLRALRQVLPAAIASGLLIVSRPRLFGVAPLVAVGRISYGLYLWHFPLAMLLPAWAAFFGSFLAAGLSYRFVEQPIRRAAAKWRTGPDRRETVDQSAIPDRPAVTDTIAVADRPIVPDDRGVIKPAVTGRAASPAVPPTIVRRDPDTA
jgi:peptidoglycan/LPS O-acetylase OafA/YrhL